MGSNLVGSGGQRYERKMCNPHVRVTSETEAATVTETEEKIIPKSFERGTTGVHSSTFRKRRKITVVKTITTHITTMTTVESESDSD